MIVAVAALVVPLILFVGASWIAHGDNQREADERMRRTLDLLYNNVRITFESEYLVAANVAEQLDDYPTNADIAANEAKIHERLKHLVEGLPQVEDVWVLDEKGAPLVAAHVHPMPPGLNYGDRPYFTALRDGRVERIVSDRLHGRLKDIDSLRICRAPRAARRRLQRAVAVSLAPSYFVDQFARASDSKLSTASLVRADGAFLARHPRHLRSDAAGAGDGLHARPPDGARRGRLCHHEFRLRRRGASLPLPQAAQPSDLRVARLRARHDPRHLDRPYVVAPDLRHSRDARPVWTRRARLAPRAAADRDADPAARGGAAARARRGEPAAGAEDERDRPAHRRHRARLQQFADRHRRRAGDGRAAPVRAVVGDRTLPRPRQERRDARGDAHAAPARLRPPAAAADRADRRQQACCEHVRAAAQDAGRKGRDRDGAVGRPVARPGRRSRSSRAPS